METPALVNDLVPIKIPLNNVYLDPNNPRFVEYEWSYVSEADIASDVVQEKTRRLLIDKFNVEKLRMNMEINGYLPIDHVIVREFSKSKYVVLEGNRRICAAKLISDVASDGTIISNEVKESLIDIPCLEYIGSDTRAAWVFQGLRHISGINDWSAFNKAKLLVEQMEEEGLNITTVGKRFGLTPHGTGQWVRGFYAFKQASEKSDYVEEVDERAYTYFQELFNRSSARVREWMEWNDNEKKFDNVLNFNEFVGWLYPRDETDDDDNLVNSKQRGDWEQRVLKRRDDLRQVSFLIHEDKEIFEKFRRELDIEKAYSEAITRKYEKEARESYDPGEEVFATIQACVKAINDIPLRLVRDRTSKQRLLTLIKELEDAISLVKE